MTKCRRSSHGQFQTLLHFGQGNWFLALEDFLFGENPSCLFTTPIWPLTTSEKWLPSSMLSSCDRLAWSPAVNEWKKCFIMKFGIRKKCVHSTSVWTIENTKYVVYVIESNQDLNFRLVTGLLNQSTLKCSKSYSNFGLCPIYLLTYSVLQESTLKYLHF